VNQGYRAAALGITLMCMTKLLAVLLLVSGCSVALQPKPRAGSVASGCSTSSTYWIADAVGVGVGGAAAVTGVVLSETGYKDVGLLTTGVGLVAGVIYYASMDNGRKWARECSTRSESIATR
jgi:predicted MFS family arabinose efflux permease